VTFDCAAEAQVQCIADACLAEGCRHFAGAADLGGALAQRVLGPARPVRRPRDLPWTILAGSVSATTFGQLRAWKAAGRVWLPRLRPQGPAWRLDRGTAAARRALRSGAVALSSLAAREDLEPWRRGQALQGRPPAACAADAMEGLARWGLSVAGGPACCGWFVTGGHSLQALNSAAGFTRFSILGEVLPEVPLGRAEGPRGGAWLCSKPGGFGDEDCFNRFMGDPS
jgi:uncharacterized protein YgbK (DUF1537 family)